MPKLSTERRLFQYAWQYRRSIFIGLIFLILATTLELAGPFIAKTIIDDHILGIESVWYEVDEDSQEKGVVTFDDSTYQREDRLQLSPKEGARTILAVDRTYYLVEGVAPLEGERHYTEGKMTISGEEEETFRARPLDRAELHQLFQREQKSIGLWLLLYVVLLILASFSEYIQTYKLQEASNRILRQMRNDVFHHIQQVPLAYFSRHGAGQIVGRLTNDTEAIRELYERVLSVVMTRIIYMAGILVALYLLEPKMALLALFIVPLIFLWAWLYKRFAYRLNISIRRTNSAINGKINELIQGMDIIQAFRAEKKQKEAFEQWNEKMFKEQKRLITLNALTSFNLVTFLRNLTFVCFLVYVGNLSFEPGSVLSIGMLYALVDYINRFFEPVTAIVNQFPLIEQARASAKRTFDLVDLETEAVDHRPIPRYRGEISFEGVSFAYEEEKVLKDIHFHIRPGETAAFVGHTGSGKSTIMNLLLRFYDPDEGDIKIDGMSTRKLSRQQVRSHMAIVLQDSFLFEGTILSNVTMNHPHISRREAIQALEAVGADRFITKLPKRYDALVTEGGKDFSLGERQLISFARALAHDPAILLLDEATANIDTETEQLIQEALRLLQKGRTTLIIAHRLSTIKEADQIFVLDNGKIIESGRHDYLLEQKGLYEEMYRLQTSMYT